MGRSVVSLSSARALASQQHEANAYESDCADARFNTSTMPSKASPEDTPTSTRSRASVIAHSLVGRASSEEGMALANADATDIWVAA